jgi:acyl dehydratase
MSKILRPALAQQVRGANSDLRRENFMPPLILENPQSLKDFVGREIGASDWLVVTQARIAQFAEATEDRQWIHLDRERASRDSPFGTTVAHGFLTLSLISHLMKEAVQIKSGVRLAVNYGLNRVRFPRPVRADSKIRARFTVLALEELPKALEVVFSVTVEGESGDKPCCVAEWIVRYYL